MTIQPRLAVAEEPSDAAAREWERCRELKYRTEADFSRHADDRITKMPADPGNRFDCRTIYVITDAAGRTRRFDRRGDAERFLRRELLRFGGVQFTPSMFGA